MRIKQILDSLDAKRREEIMLAFEECNAHWVPAMAQDHFLGVHIQDFTGKVKIIEEGVWVYGKRCL